MAVVSVVVLLRSAARYVEEKIAAVFFPVEDTEALSRCMGGTLG